MGRISKNKIAIVIPYYKIAFFDEVLKSLANQTDKRFKVYIGDDASPDNPEHLLEKYQGKFDFNYHKFSYNLGSKSLTNHWERCILLSEDEEWIMIFGDDDFIEENAIQNFYDNFKEINAIQSNIVRYSTQLINGDSKILSQNFHHPKIEKISDFFFRKFSGQTRSSLSEYIFRKNVYLKYKFKHYPIGWHSDDMALLDFSEEKAVFTINESLIKIRVSEKSLSGSNSNIKEKRFAEFLFYSDLVNYKLGLFKKNEKLFFLYQFESSIKRIRKLSINEWFLLFGKYLSNFSTFPFLRFLRRFFISFK